MSDRQSLVNVTLKIRDKFHSNRLVRFRDILHTVSKHLVSRKTRLKLQNVIFHMYPLLTFFFYRGSQFLQYTTKLTPSPLIFDSSKVIFASHDLHFVILLKVANSDTNSIIPYLRIYYYTPNWVGLKSRTFCILFLRLQTSKKVDFLKMSNYTDPLNQQLRYRISQCSIKMANSC